MSAQFPEPIVHESDPIEHLLSSKVMGKPLSSLYVPLSVAYESVLNRTFERWKGGIPDLTEEEWEGCVSSYVSSMILAWDRFM